MWLPEKNLEATPRLAVLLQIEFARAGESSARDAGSTLAGSQRASRSNPAKASRSCVASVGMMTSAEAPRRGKRRDIATPLKTLWAIAQCYAVVAVACGGYASLTGGFKPKTRVTVRARESPRPLRSFAREPASPPRSRAPSTR